MAFAFVSFLPWKWDWGIGHDVRCDMEDPNDHIYLSCTQIWSFWNSSCDTPCPRLYPNPGPTGHCICSEACFFPTSNQPQQIPPPPKNKKNPTPPQKKTTTQKIKKRKITSHETTITTSCRYAFPRHQHTPTCWVQREISPTWSDSSKLGL